MREVINNNVILKVAGKNFRCDCGCNVFTKIKENEKYKYKCNSCETEYK